MVGTGSLSRYFVEGHLAVRKYQSILVWGRDPLKAAAVAQDLGARGWPVTAAGDLAAAAPVGGCDQLCHAGGAASHPKAAGSNPNVTWIWSAASDPT